MIARFLAWLRSIFGMSKALTFGLPSGWSLLYSHGVPAQMTPVADGTFYFDFPQQDGVHYVLSPAGPASLGQTITMTFAIEGDGKLIPVDGDPTARVRLLIQQKGDNLSTPDARWWSAPVILNGAGEYTLSAPLVFEQWSTIGGGLPTEGAVGFARCVSEIANIGFSFGGWSAGHGVYAQGPSRFILRSFTVQ